MSVKLPREITMVTGELRGQEPNKVTVWFIMGFASEIPRRKVFSWGASSPASFSMAARCTLSLAVLKTRTFVPFRSLIASMTERVPYISSMVLSMPEARAGVGFRLNWSVS